MRSPSKMSLDGPTRYRMTTRGSRSPEGVTVAGTVDRRLLRTSIVRCDLRAAAGERTDALREVERIAAGVQPGRSGKRSNARPSRQLGPGAAPGSGSSDSSTHVQVSGRTPACAEAFGHSGVNLHGQAIGRCLVDDACEVDRPVGEHVDGEKLRAPVVAFTELAARAPFRGDGSPTASAPSGMRLQAGMPVVRGG